MPKPIMHYNEVIVRPFEEQGFDVVFQPSCLGRPWSGAKWPVIFPENVEWKDNTIVVMHCQDWITVDHTGLCPELLEMEEWFGPAAHRVFVIVWNLDIPYEGPLNLIYLPTHSYELITELRKTQDEWKPGLLEPRTKNWQCLQGWRKDHRTRLTELMQQFDNGILSYGKDIPLPGAEYNQFYAWDNVENWKNLQFVYSNCKTNVVSETWYAGYPSIISEKTLMAFMALQVPVVISYRGIVGHCEDLGFDMFRDVVETDYDTYQDDVRMEQAIVLNKSVVNGEYDYDALLPRLLRNQEYVLNEWPELLLEQFNNTVQGMCENLRQSS